MINVCRPSLGELTSKHFMQTGRNKSTLYDVCKNSKAFNILHFRCHHHSDSSYKQYFQEIGLVISRTDFYTVPIVAL